MGAPTEMSIVRCVASAQPREPSGSTFRSFVVAPANSLPCEQPYIENLKSQIQRQADADRDVVHECVRLEISDLQCRNGYFCQRSACDRRIKRGRSRAWRAVAPLGARLGKQTCTTNRDILARFGTEGSEVQILSPRPIRTINRPGNGLFSYTVVRISSAVVRRSWASFDWNSDKFGQAFKPAPRIS